MHKLDDGTLVLAATDLTNYLACGHLIQQKLAVARGERSKPKPAENPHADLLSDRGNEHERSELAKLVAAAGGDYLDLSDIEFPRTRADLERAHVRTAGAMFDGVPLIFQGLLFDGRWQGRIDALVRVPTPSALGDVSYEVVDMKLARHLKPQFVHQLSVYNRLVAHVQELEPTVAHVILGDGSTQEIELTRYAALHRHVVRQVEKLVESPATETYPEPVAHCALCDYADECDRRRRADDHLSLVAGIRRDQREKLVDVEIDTVATLAAAGPDDDHGRIAAEQFDLLRHQAALQVRSRDDGKPHHRHLDPAPERGYARLPDPSPGDIFFDLEGDPYLGLHGIEYLWGWWTEDGYDCIWAHDEDAEREALERFVDLVLERRRIYPDLHVYHYAPLEAATLESLALRYATREEEVDTLLRAGVLVDLYAVVRQGLQVGEESYSLKRLERHHGFERLEKSIRAGGGSIVAYETWLESGSDELLESIRAYNEDDVRSTWALRNWLYGTMKPEAVAQFGADAFAPGEPEEPFGPPAWLADVNDLIARLTAAPDSERTLLSHLLLYHYRESKPEWWRFFDLSAKTPAELIDEREALAGLAIDSDWTPRPYKRSLDYRFTFPPQEFKLEPGQVLDPTTGDGHNLVEVGDDYVVLRRGNKKPPPAPAALIAGQPVDAKVMRHALVEVAEDLVAGGTRFAAAHAILRRERPRLSSGRLGPGLETLVGATLGLDRSYLPIQGPPGTGKTWSGARMVVEALRAGRRVGVTAFSHAAIQNLLHDIEDYAAEIGYAFSGLYKGYSYDSRHGLVELVESNDEAAGGDFQLVAGTAWLLSRPEWREQLGIVFIDEAGQFSLASAIAVATSAENVVLLGDPQQLPQVTQASHPEGGSGDSVLEYVLDGRPTMPPDRGVLLEESWRMHPDITRFVSERSYENRLRSRPACAQRRIDSAGPLSGAGLRMVAVEHEGRSQASEEEAEAIAALCGELLRDAVVTNAAGEQRDLTAEEIMVVAPYNLAVRCIRERVPDGVRVGTVDKFQGQQAPVVFFAMTCSSGEDVPRGMDFLFNRNRLNVAVSRAQCLAVVVASPRLLDADCKMLEQMELVDGVCRFAELAEPVVAASEPAVSLP